MFASCTGCCLSIALLFNKFLHEFPLWAVLCCVLILVNLQKHVACVFLYVFGELLDMILVQLIECFSVENGEVL